MSSIKDCKKCKFAKLCTCRDDDDNRGVICDYFEPIPECDPLYSLGKWLCIPIENNDTFFYSIITKCSVCWLTLDPIATSFMNFCPRCGKPMTQQAISYLKDRRENDERYIKRKYKEVTDHEKG